MQKDESKVLFARCWAAFDELVKIIGAIVVLETAGIKEHYLSICNSRYHLKERDYLC